jgi:hypothetical protein
MIGIINAKTKPFFENTARLFSRWAYADSLLNDWFYSVLKFFRFPLFERGPGRRWCEIQHYKGICSLPNGRFCSSECMQGSGLSSKCPEGFQPSHAWGYRFTGCWCDTFQGRSIVCCDCTPVSNHPYNPTAADCGCMHFLE